MAKEASLKLIELIDLSLKCNNDKGYFGDLGKALCSVYYSKEYNLITKWLLNYNNYYMSDNLKFIFINALKDFTYIDKRVVSFKDKNLSLNEAKEKLENFISILKKLELQEKAINNYINNKNVRTTKVNIINKDKIAALNNKLMTDINRELYTNFNEGYLALIEDKKESIDLSNYDKMIDFHNKLEKIKSQKILKLIPSDTSINEVEDNELEGVFFTNVSIDNFGNKLKSIEVLKSYDIYKFCTNTTDLNLNNICNDIIRKGFNFKDDYIVSKTLLYRCLAALIDERTKKGKCIKCNKKLGVFYKSPICRLCS